MPGSVFKRFQYSDWVREHDNIIIIVVDKAHNPAVVEFHQNEMNKRSEQLMVAETVKSISSQKEGRKRVGDARTSRQKTQDRRKGSVR